MHKLDAHIEDVFASQEPFKHGESPVEFPFYRTPPSERQLEDALHHKNNAKHKENSLLLLCALAGCNSPISPEATAHLYEDTKVQTNFECALSLQTGNDLLLAKL